MPPGDTVTQARFLAHDSLREGQIDMINDGLKVISEGGFLLANAPTGIGKTAAALAAALTVARSRTGARVLFLTGRQSQHRIVVDTVRKINDRIKDKPFVLYNSPRQILRASQGCKIPEPVMIARRQAIILRRDCKQPHVNSLTGRISFPRKFQR